MIDWVLVALNAELDTGIAMENHVVRVDKCECCGEKHEYVVRSEKWGICSKLTDGDIHFIVAGYGDKPQRYGHCESCHFLTLKTTVGWIGV